MKKEKSRKQFLRGRIIALSLFAVLAIVLNILINVFSGYADLYLGKGKAVITTAEGTEDWDSEYYSLDYASEMLLKEAAEDLVKKIEAEGAVLLKNNGALPLETSASNRTKITLMGRDAVDSVFGGSGSGSVDISTVVDLKEGLEKANYSINETVYSLFDSFAAYTMGRNNFGQPAKKYENPKADIVMDKPQDSTYYIGEMPVDRFTDDALASFSTYDDAAIIMFGRGGGEGGDLSQNMKGFEENYEPGQHQLELNKDEKDLLELAKKNFDKVIVLINSSAAMEMGILEDDPEIDAVLWVGSPGQTGFLAVGEILNGTVNPSGRTADIYAADFTKDPTFVNFGHFQYSNISRNNSYGDAFLVEYEEGIYMGYRYYETAAAEGFINYDEAVVYPFGFGLSYTDFHWEVTSREIGDINGSISVDVRVTNKGDRAGKEVVQLYYSAPYYKGGVEKSEVVLGDFAKTGLLGPGESETVTLSIAVEDMASYDFLQERAYVLDKGDYRIRLQTDSHNMKEGVDEIVYSVDSTIVYKDRSGRESDLVAATNLFDDVSSEISRTLSRSDFAGTFPTAPKAEDLKASDAVLAAFAPYWAGDHDDPEAEMPVTGAENGISLINMRGRDFSDPLWEPFLDQLNPEDIITIVINSAYNTGEIDNIGKPATVDLDGPAGINSFMGANIHGVAYTSAVVIASTFSTEIAFEMGEMVGNEGLFYDVHGWYAPAVNIHRSPFAGRNFEYYSEDPYLSGKIGTSVVEGTASKGVYAYVKHYALNDQEANRNANGVATWANEQSIREIYLKPFELIVKNAETTVKYISDEAGTVSEKIMPASTAIMSSFNRIGGVWAGGSVPLMQNILRDEWGFKGVVISDFNLYDHMDVNQGLAAGTDINITFESMKSMDETESATVVQQLRRTGHRLLYTVANSHAMNGIVPGATVTFTMAPWMIGLIAADILIALLLALGIFITLRKAGKLN
ncbi:glycoside hydrolase family 3 C-terminal domain-containing protein [Spirochaeta isovalerica]|uniref:Beta-glucosidase n=1 Tax=Spirochaeta isovalerica TaxID=150 RepID=A0A841R7M0_9SPIO|nr:glycoside hydrolase family 3 C-terminal domain-containing protein [Spirochaeta isovalerica]MBB6479853.1 beta-glucosidase [Spirochaeta isovalerica]